MMLIAKRDGLRLDGREFDRGDTLPAVPARLKMQLVSSNWATERPDPVGWEGPVVYDPPTPKAQRKTRKREG